MRRRLRPRARACASTRHKLLIDPYAKALTGKAENADNLLLGYDPDDPRRDLSLDAPRQRRASSRSASWWTTRFDWQGDAPPDIPLEQLLIYEVHVKGFTAHPSSRRRAPGTYLGFIEKIPYLQAPGDQRRRAAAGARALRRGLPASERGLTNYWGYNTLGFFAPESVLRHGHAPRAARSASSRRWCASCTGPGSR